MVGTPLPLPCLSRGQHSSSTAGTLDQAATQQPAAVSHHPACWLHASLFMRFHAGAHAPTCMHRFQAAETSPAEQRQARIDCCIACSTPARVSLHSPRAATRAQRGSATPEVAPGHRQQPSPCRCPSTSMTRSMRDMQATAEPNTQEEAEPSTQEGSEHVLQSLTAAAAAPTAAPACTPGRVFVNADFAHTEYENCHLTAEQFEQYKQRFLGKPVPPQDVSNDDLVALGYEMPEPWIQCCIEENMPNYT